MSAILFAVFVSISILTASILLPTLLLTPILSRSSSTDVVSKEICFYCSMSLEENLAVGSLTTLVLSYRQIVSDLISFSSWGCLLNSSLWFFFLLYIVEALTGLHQGKKMNHWWNQEMGNFITGSGLCVCRGRHDEE